MSFKDQVAADNSSVFLNALEFAELRSIDGRAPVACVLDDAERITDPVIEGVYVSRSTLHVRTSDLPSLPAITQRMVIDGKAGRVVHVDEALGIAAIRLEWFES